MNKHEEFEKHTHLHQHDHYHAYNCGHLDLQDEAEVSAKGEINSEVLRAKNKQKAHEYNKVTIKVSRSITIVNVILACAKLFAGLIGNSSALVADSMHAFSDVFGSLAMYIGMKFSDSEKNRGKEGLRQRIEGCISLALGVVLVFLAGEIGLTAFQTIQSGSYGAEVPSLLPLVVAVVAIIVKEGVYFYSIKFAKQINSIGLKAMAWHNQTDALISLGSFVGILGSRLGYPICDPLASIILCVLVLRVAVEIIIEAVRALKK